MSTCGSTAPPSTPDTKTLSLHCPPSAHLPLHPSRSVRSNCSSWFFEPRPTLLVLRADTASHKTKVTVGWEGRPNEGNRRRRGSRGPELHSARFIVDQCAERARTQLAAPVGAARHQDRQRERSLGAKYGRTPMVSASLSGTGDVSGLAFGESMSPTRSHLGLPLSERRTKAGTRTRPMADLDA